MMKKEKKKKRSKENVVKKKKERQAADRDHLLNELFSEQYESTHSSMLSHCSLHYKMTVVVVQRTGYHTTI